MPVTTYMPDLPIARAERILAELIRRKVGETPGDIEFIKELTQQLGIGLGPAKSLADHLLRGIPLPENLVNTDVEGILSRVYSETTVSGRTNMLDMIKRVREETGLGLKESKDLVDAFVRKRNPEMAARKGCVGGILGLFRF